MPWYLQVKICKDATDDGWIKTTRHYLEETWSCEFYASVLLKMRNIFGTSVPLCIRLRRLEEMPSANACHLSLVETYWPWTSSQLGEANRWPIRNMKHVERHPQKPSFHGRQVVHLLSGSLYNVPGSKVALGWVAIPLRIVFSSNGDYINPQIRASGTRVKQVEVLRMALMRLNSRPQPIRFFVPNEENYSRYTTGKGSTLLR